jgi:hypothetical protein
MSELTTCNYCNLQGIRCRAKKEKKKVTLIPAMGGGTDVFVHPKNICIRELSLQKRKDYFTAWLMEISDRCVC